MDYHNNNYSKVYKHTRNGLVQRKMITYNTGFQISLNIATGIDGESSFLTIYDKNLYPDDDSRSENDPSRGYIVPFSDTADLIEFRNMIDEAISKRNETIIDEKHKL